jgi:molybdopterin synthase sulfur carrier subunit
LLRSLTGGQETVTVAGATEGDVIDQHERLFPGVKDRLCDGGRLRPGIAAAVDTQVARLGVDEPVGENSEVHFLPAISGG